MLVTMNVQSDITVICPSNNTEERRYIVDTLFTFLNINPIIIFENDAQNYIIQHKDKKIIIKDGFFNHYPTDLTYLDINNIPKSTSRFTDISGQDLVLIFGDNQYYETSNTITCGLDIFASAFYMLSRWEELVLANRDNLSRCNEDDLLAVRCDFYTRPVVNEYCEFLSSMLNQIGFNFTPNVNKYKEVNLSHDVDRVYLSGFFELIKNTSKMFLNLNFKKPVAIISRFLYYKITNQQPFYSFTDLMDYSDRYNLKNHFYFKACLPDENGYTYSVDDERVERALNNIQARGHMVGFHPSENAFNNPQQFTSELNRLNTKLSKAPQGGRSHQLLYNGESLESWERSGLGYDSGCGFQFYNGFRSGVCYSYPVFNIESRKTLNLLEKPFIAMDSVWLRQNISPQQYLEDVRKLIDTVSEYNGLICMNWHSNLINTIEMRKLRGVYFKLVDYIGEY